jgi:2,4-dienoyl-CoA reductase-like NADH-dependent reductase (Old Yellow Enzyme family)
MPDLFDPIRVGALDLPNRIFMSPLTRSRASLDARVPGDLARDYYQQRASAGLIISEATSVDPMGVGYAGTPGIWSPEQVAGWRRVTDAVHRAGGRMFLQLWHVGRISDPSFLDGKEPVAPSAIAARGNVSILRPERPFPIPRELKTQEVRDVVEQFRQGAENAQQAGFDGVEVHGANGYLLDQFLQDGSNHREDEYGGAIENRARLMLEVADAAIAVWGADRVGMHLAPRADAHDMGDSDRAETFGYVARELGRRKLAFILAREFIAEDSLGPKLKEAFGGVYVINEKLDLATAQEALRTNRADACAFGVKFIANPDLPHRFALNAPLNPLDKATLYAGGAAGYTDYPALTETQTA